MSSSTSAPTTRPAGDPAQAEHPAAPTGRALLVVVLALALGGFGIGTTEFVSMGLLPEIAAGIDASIPRTGHVISAYALGVVVGAPVVAVLAARASRRTLLAWLMVAFVVGNAASALAPTYGSLFAARFAAGLPHGAYFGVAALVAASLVPSNRRAAAIGWVMMGLSVANVVGVPAATWLGQELGWRSAYWAVTVIGVASVLAVLRFVPSAPGDPSADPARELGALRTPQVLLTLLVGTVGFGGMFAVYTYVAPTMTEVAGVGERAMPLVLALAGVGMVVGNLVGGWVVDAGVVRGVVVGLVAVAALMAVFPLAVQTPVTAIAVVMLVQVAAGILVPALQTRLMDVAGDGQTLAASLNHAALNVANALGAWLGGLTIAAGLGYESTGVVGLVLAVVGLLVLGAALALDRRRRTPPPPARTTASPANA